MAKFDSRGRELYAGETYDEKSGKYRYTYVDTTTKKRTSVYSYTLIPSDRVPLGKKQKAEDSLREKKRRIRDGTYHRKSDVGADKDGDSLTLLEIMQVHCEKRSIEVRESTKKGYTTMINFMKKNPKVGNKKLSSFESLEDGRKFFKELHKKYGLNNSSLHTLRGILRPAVKDLIDKNKATLNPFDFRILDTDFGGVKYRNALSQKDIKRYLDFLRTDPHFKKYFYGVLILISTGLRISEFCGLNEKDIDFEKHELTVNRQLLRFPTNDYKVYYYISKPKTRHGSRVIPLTPDVEFALREVIKNRPHYVHEELVWDLDKNENATGFLWVDKDGRYEVAQHWQNHIRWSVAKYNRIYKEQLPPISCHIFRHTYITMMAKHLLPQELMVLAGHGDSKTTIKIYTHLHNEELAEKCYEKFVSGAISFYDMNEPIKVSAPSNDFSGEETEPDFSEPVDEVDDEE